MTKAEWRRRLVLIIQYKEKQISRAEFIKKWRELWLVYTGAEND